MASRAAAKAAEAEGNGADQDAGLTPAPADVQTEGAGMADQPEPAADVTRKYTALVSSDAVDGPDGDARWRELGEVDAATRPEAWEAAKKKWPGELVPPQPATPDEPTGEIKAKIIPSRNFVTITSKVEYQAPKQVATGV